MTDPAPAPDLSVTVGPTPTEEEAVAIAAALQVVLVAGPPTWGAPVAPARWRMSGRWWAKPVPSRRDRPSVV